MIPHDVLEKAPHDTGCRAACFVHCLSQLIKTIDDAHLTADCGIGVLRILEAKEYAETTMEYVYREGN